MMMRLGLFCVLVLTSVSFASADEADWSAANDLPPLLEFQDGQKVETQEDWRKRKAEIRSLLLTHFVGAFPEEVPGVIKSEVISDQTQPDGSKRKRIRLTFDTPNQTSFEMAVWTPPGEGPFPLLLTAPKDYQVRWAKDAVARGYTACLFP